MAGLDDLRAELEEEAVILSPSARNDGLLLKFIPLFVVFAVACDGRSSVRMAEASIADSNAMRARQDSIVRSRPGYIVDSILPVEEEIRRFQASLDRRPTAFANGATSRSELVRRFVHAVEANDTTAIARLVIDRAEFGYLVYPTSPNAAPPYRQSPGLVWLTRSAGTEKGANRLLTRYGGRRLGYAGYSCSGAADRQGENTIWAQCAVRVANTGGDTSTLRLFGPIVERGGRFKFLSLTNGL